MYVRVKGRSMNIEDLTQSDIQRMSDAELKQLWGMRPSYSELTSNQDWTWLFAAKEVRHRRLEVTC